MAPVEEERVTEHSPVLRWVEKEPFPKLVNDGKMRKQRKHTGKFIHAMLTLNNNGCSLNRLTLQTIHGF